MANVRIARLIDFERAIEEVRAPALYNIHRVSLELGRSARLLETLRGFEEVDRTKLCDFASEFAYTPTYVDSILVPQFEKLGVMERQGEAYRVMVPSSAAILDLMQKQWDAADKDPHDVLMLEILSDVASRPYQAADLRKRHANAPLEIYNEVVLTLQATNQVVETMIEGGKYYASAGFAASKSDAVSQLVKKLDDQELGRLGTAYNHVADYQGLPSSRLPEAKLTRGLVETGSLLGIFDPVSVKTPKFSKEFLFTNDAFSGLDGDAFHNTKQTIAHFRYAQDYADYNLTMLPRFLGKLLDQGEAGPATPIGTDYKFLERQGIVRVQKLAVSGKAMMILVPGKEDIIRNTLNVIESGRAALPRVERLTIQEQLRRIQAPPEARTSINADRLSELTMKLTDRMRRL